MPCKTDEIARMEDPHSVLATNTAPVNNRASTLLQVVPVRIHGAEGAYVDTCALLDSGADTSLCAEDVLRRLSITGQAEPLCLNNVEGTGTKRIAVRTSLQISPLTDSERTERVTVSEVFSVRKLNVRPQKIDWTERNEWKHLAGIPLPDINGRPVELLLGANVLEALLQKESRVGPPGQPAAIRTHFGWCLTGNLKQMLPAGARKVFHVRAEHTAEDTMTEVMESWWSTEAFGTSLDLKVSCSVDGRQTEQLLEEMTRWRGDRYKTGLLWRSDAVNLPYDYGMVLRRLETTGRGLKITSDKTAAFQKTTQERRKRLRSEPVQEGATTVSRPVLVPPSPRRRHEPEQTGKNPSRLRRRSEVRRHISKREPADRARLSADHTRSCDAVQTGSSCPERRHREDVPAGEGFAAATTIRDHIYRDQTMDDLAASEKDVPTAPQAVSEVSALVSKGGFKHGKWLSNRKEVLAAIPTEEPVSNAADLRKPLPTKNVLGTMWDAQRDNKFVSHPSADSEDTETKRSILRVVALIYDPVGLLSPFTLLAKLILKYPWSARRDWDEQLDAVEGRQWAAWLAELPRLSAIMVPRWYERYGEPPRLRQLHVFCDASERKRESLVLHSSFRQVYRDGQVHCRR